MQEAEFKRWLQDGGAVAEDAINTRIYAIRTIERNLKELGSPHDTLDSAYRLDQFTQLRQRIADMRTEEAIARQDYRILMPQSLKPLNRLSSWRSWLGLYGRFLSGEVRAPRDADRIRQYVLDHYIEPARERDDPSVDVLVRDVNTALGLKDGWPNISQSLNGPIFQEFADVAAPERIGADASPATVFRFHFDDRDDKEAGKSFVLFDREGAAFAPTRMRSRIDERIAFRVKPDGATNEASHALAFDNLIDVARAMLIELLPARVRPISGGNANYLSYGVGKLVRYELDPQIAEELGILPHGNAKEKLSEAKPAPPPAGDPTNLILYGPPGTGKTHETAIEAVRLCGEPVPSDRMELMTTYRRLLEAGRIEFVTFHQSMSYEDFVEGLRPSRGADDASIGFELKPEPGVFRRIARRAETSTGPGDVTYSLAGRQIFKMSIGAANNPDDAYLFEEAIAGSYTLLGYEDIDWSDSKYANRNEIIDAVRTYGVTSNEDPTAMSGRVQMPFIFRNGLKKGDIIIVSKGNGLFRAIGEVTGDYQFAPREGGDYGHRRAVKWLWIDRAGLPVSELYARNFTMKSIYLLTPSEINLRALERYATSQQNVGRGAPEPFVLIIDEINRANISKVFGELITLLEHDKRLGKLNELKVRLPYSKDPFGVPSNLHLLGTMNTADRSIALLDTALRRRFTFRELMPDPTKLSVVDGIDLAALLTALNERIEYLFDREHQIGHAYFMSCTSKAQIDDVMRNKIIPLLSEYFYDDWQKVAIVLGDADNREGDRQGKFMDRHQIKAPRGMSDENDDAPLRYRWSVRGEFSYQDFMAT
jgi:5-methylcytosine-specific restriction protein B